MKWSYKTVHFELKKEGLLGGSFLDETEVEEQLNQYGRSGWELTSVIEVQDGIIAFFKQPLDLDISSRLRESAIDGDNADQVVEEPYVADHEYQTQEQTLPEATYNEERNTYPEEHEVDDHDFDDSQITDYGYEDPVLVDDDRDLFEDQDSDDEQGEHPDQKGIGAIRIE